jgi:hypothetical protein
MVTDPNIIAELKRIAAASGGELRAEIVVEEARAVESPMHSWFQWDDTAAAHQYRIIQARQLIRVTVTYIGDGQNKIPMRVFVSLTPDRELDSGGYRVMADVMENAESRQQLLRDALAEMDRFKAKYSALKELAELFMAIKSTKRKISQKAEFQKAS